GVPRDDRLVREGLEFLRATWRAQKTAEHRTYVVALMCMAAAEDDPAEAAPSGTTDRGPRPLADADLDWLRQMVRWLESVQHGGGWSYGVDGGGYDLSNTQYALLGLRAAARRGVV